MLVYQRVYTVLGTHVFECLFGTVYIAFENHSRVKSFCQECPAPQVFHCSKQKDIICAFSYSQLPIGHRLFLSTKMSPSELSQVKKGPVHASLKLKADCLQDATVPWQK